MQNFFFRFSFLSEESSESGLRADEAIKIKAWRNSMLNIVGSKIKDFDNQKFNSKG